MYLYNRTEAGRLLADILEPVYSDEPNIVMALSPGGVLVGQEIAKRLNCEMTLLLIKSIRLPGIEGPVIGTIDQEGGFTYNNMFSAGELEELVAEFYQFIELEKMNQLHEINQALGKGGIIDRHYMDDHNVILVTDGVKNGTSFDAAISYLKPVRTSKIVAAVPFASITAVDRLHILTDDINCLDVRANYFDTDHYYEDNYIPENDEITEIITRIDEQDPVAASYE